MRRLLFPIALLFLSFPGCSEDLSPYVVEFTTSPANPVPNRPFNIAAAVTSREDGTPATDVTVDGVIRVGGPAVSLGSLGQGDPGVFSYFGISIDREAVAEVRFSIQGPVASGSSTHRVRISCDGDGAIGSACCAPTDCGDGLYCVYAACQPALGQVDDACYESAECGSGLCENGLCAPTVPILGGGTHSMESLRVSVIGTFEDNLASPRDVAVHPLRPSEVWVANTRGESVVVFTNPASSGQTASTYWTPSAHHFFARVSSIAFGIDGEMASSHETDVRTQGNLTPPDFMGPTLHYTDLSIFNAGLESHLDMLHNSPNGMGIAWEGGRDFWLFDGYHSSLTRYAFNEDHGLGGSDHTDGVIRRYAQGEVRRVAGVVSHMEMDRDARMLYVADTGNNRIAMLDITTGSVGGNIAPNYDDCDMKMVNGAVLTTVVEGAAYGLQRPAGLALTEELLFITDNGTSRILAFDRTTWELVDYLDTQLPPGSLNGMELGPDGSLYFTDVLGDRLYQVRVPEE